MILLKTTMRAALLFPLAFQLAAEGDSILPQTQPAPAFEWRPALEQSLSFLLVQHSFRLALQPHTRAAMKGSYLRDWFRTASNVRGWDDGDTMVTNYIGHPMEGAIAAYIQVQNDPRFRKARFNDEGYWASRLRAFVWSSLYSTNYELGPLGDAAIGNVGMGPKHKGSVDLVVTPTFGMGWMVTEDVVDKHVVLWLERNWNNPLTRAMVRSWLNPSRSLSNVLRGRWPWHRDDRGGVRE